MKVESPFDDVTVVSKTTEAESSKLIGSREVTMTSHEACVQYQCGFVFFVKYNKVLNVKGILQSLLNSKIFFLIISKAQSKYFSCSFRTTLCLDFYFPKNFFELLEYVYD